MGQEVETFVRLSIRYQILIAQEVAKNTGKRVYVFDSTKLFQNEPTTEIVGNVNTLVKDGLRAVISIAVEESFGSNKQLFLEYVDQDVLVEDQIGLFVLPTEQPGVPVATTETEEDNEDNEDDEESDEEEDNVQMLNSVKEEYEESTEIKLVNALTDIKLDN